MDEKVYFQGVDGTRLRYRRWKPAQQKQNTPIVLLHGAASNSTRWWHFVEHSRLATDRLLLRPDLRGHGESIWRGPAHMEHWSQDIAEMLRKEHQPRAILVGHCLGANVALNFAARYPEMSAGLILIEPMVRKALSGTLALLRLFLPVLQLIVRLLRFFNRNGLYRRRLEYVNLRELDRQVYEANCTALTQLFTNHGSPWQDIKVTPSAQYINNFIEFMRPLPVSGVHCPCLVIQSSGGKITNPKRTRIKLESLPAVDFTEVNSEHWLPTTQPDRLCQLIDAWVMRH